MMKSIKRLIVIGVLSSSVCILPTTGVKAEWRSDSKGWWYSQGNSWATGWLQDSDGKWYYFNQDGYMAHDTTIDGKYNVDNNGVWIQNTTVNTTSNNNSNNINSVTNNINNGQIINNNNTNVYINNTTTNNVSSSSNNENTENDKTYDGTDGFKKIGNDKYVYYEDGVMLENTWKKFKEGYRHFNKDGYMDFSKTIDGLAINENGLYPIKNKYENSKKYLFTSLVPYKTAMGKYISGNLDYIKNTYDIFGIKYDVEYKKVYDSDKDDTILSIDNSYDNWSESKDDNFNSKKVIVIGQYSSRLNLN
jgi:hypothetical protein